MAVRECEKCGHSMRMIKFTDDIKKRLTCPDCGWRKKDPKDYPHINRILVILGKNGPSGNAGGRPYPFPQKCSQDLLRLVNLETSQFITDQALEDFLYKEGDPPKGHIVWQFAERVFNGFYYD